MTIVLLIALLAGLLARQVSMPPMVGFLAAGFALEPLDTLHPGLAALDFTPMANLGVTLLLFTIGLKLDLRALLRPFVWAVATIHMGLVTGSIVVLLLVIKSWGWMLLADMGPEQLFAIGFAASFSSTVFAVKVLEQAGEVASLHGKTAIGILVMQDIVAVGYLSAVGGGLPSAWSPLVLLLIPSRALLIGFLRRCGHGELLVLGGLGLAYGAYAAFDAVGLKGDLGAMFVGAVIARSDKGNELAKSLLTIKDMLLLGFFLSIGQYGLPSGEAWRLTGVFVLALLAKPLLYFVLLTRFRLRVQTALLASMTLNQYSEFGLIVLAIASTTGVVSSEWLVILALALSCSFVICSLLNAQADAIDQRWGRALSRWQTEARVDEQQPIDIGEAKILVMGMGRLGTGAYDYLRTTYGDTVIGFDEDTSKVRHHREAGRNVRIADASDRELWPRLPKAQVEKVILALSNHRETVRVTKMLQACEFDADIAAVAKFEDHRQELKELGAIAFNYYAEAGAGFAEHVVATLEAGNRKEPVAD